MKHYWEIIKAFEEGKTLEYNGVTWNINEYDMLGFTEHLYGTNPEEWQIVKSDYDKALEVVKSEIIIDSDFNLSCYESEKVAELMVEFKNGKV